MTEHEPERTESDAAREDEVGVEIGMGEPNTFEPEEDPEAAAGDPDDTSPE